jgi:hypothetical protein
MTSLQRSVECSDVSNKEHWWQISWPNGKEHLAAREHPYLSIYELHLRNLEVLDLCADNWCVVKCIIEHALSLFWHEFDNVRLTSPQPFAHYIFIIQQGPLLYTVAYILLWNADRLTSLLCPPALAWHNEWKTILSLSAVPPLWGSPLLSRVTLLPHRPLYSNHLALLNLPNGKWKASPPLN